MLKHVAHKIHLSSVATLTTGLQAASGARLAQELHVKSFMKWVSIVKQLHRSLRSLCTMQVPVKGIVNAAAYKRHFKQSCASKLVATVCKKLFPVLA